MSRPQASGSTARGAYTGRGGGPSGGRLGTLRSTASYNSRGRRPIVLNSRHHTTPSSHSEEEQDPDAMTTEELREVEDNQSSSTPSSSENEDSRPKKKRAPPVELPTKETFHALGLEWGQARADEVLAAMKTYKTPSSDGLFEAQALQAQYNLDKTMLCITMRCSRRALDEALCV